MAGRSGGGAATSSGVNYQNRVAAYLLAAALCEVSLPEFGNDKVARIGFETTEAVDDLNVELEGGDLAYLQTKRKLSFSTSVGSEIHSVLGQFAKQFTEGSAKRPRLFLVTTSDSSQKITGTMKAALDAFRHGPEEAFRRDQPEAVRDLLDDLIAAVSEIIGGEPAASRKSAAALLRKSYVWMLDLEEGSCLEQATILNLHAKKFISPPLLWAKLISDCVTHSSLRHTVSIEGVRVLYETFLAPAGPFATEREEQILKVDFEQSAFSVGREVVLGTLPETPPDELFLFEFQRFGDDCSERVRFHGGKCFLDDAAVIDVLHRAATYEGMARFISERPDLVGERKLIIASSNSCENTEQGNCAERHRAIVRSALLVNKNLLRCLHCGKAVSSAAADIVESGSGPSIRAGLTHRSCTRADDRVLGVPKGDFFTRFDYLINFDANLWFKAAQRGQGIFASRNLYEGPGVIVWSGRRSTVPPGDFVVEYKLATGPSEFAHQRGQICRFTKAEADRAVATLDANVRAARGKGDPICISEQSRLLGTRSTLVRLLGVSEQFVELIGALARRFRQEIANVYSVRGSWYAPLAYLRAIEDGSNFTIGDFLPVLTDPFALDKYLENWKTGGIDIPQYEVMILESDGQFDDFVSDAEESGLELIVDPLVGPAGAPDFSRGIPIRPMWRVLQSRQPSPGAERGPDRNQES